MKPENSKFIELHGYKMRYYEYGKGAPMIFIHGFGTDSYSWRNNITSLSKHFHIYLLDMIGFGHSDKPNVNYTLPFFTKQIFQFLRLLKIRKTILVGASWGGGITVSFTTEFPSRVDKLILIDSIGPYGTVKGMRAVGEYNRTLVDLNDNKKSIEEVRKVLEKLLKDSYQKDEAVTKRVVNEQLKMWKTAAGRNAQLKIRAQCDFREIIDKIAKIEKPVLIVWGEKDNRLTLKSAKWYQNKIKGSKLVIIPNAGHAPHETHPAIVNSEILKFLKE